MQKATKKWNLSFSKFILIEKTECYKSKSEFLTTNSSYNFSTENFLVLNIGNSNTEQNPLWHNQKAYGFLIISGGIL